jgi:hypothetical protein
MPGQPAASNFLQISLKRAFRLKIEPEEVLPQEREALARAVPPVTDPEVQAFLSWRRSLLFVIAVLLIPITALDGLSAFKQDDLPAGMETLRTLEMLTFLISVGFTVVAWLLLKQWTQWKKQRRLLAVAWAVYFLAPFLVFLYPFRAMAPEGNNQVALLLGMIGSVVAFLELAPTAVSLMPGLVRSSIVSKLLFPGSSAPGWLILLTTPIYGLLIYVVLLTPYQITGNGFFIVAMVGLIGAQVWLGSVGFGLAKPMAQIEALAAMRKARIVYFVANLLGLVFVGVALSDLISAFDLSPVDVAQALVSLLVKVLLLTLVVTDIMLLAFERARGIAGDERSADLHQQYNLHLSRFMGAEHDRTPPR